MLFTSLVFGIFLPIVFAAYWMICYPKRGCEVSVVRLWGQNLLVVAASYVFYGWWSWKFLLLIFFTSVWAYVSGVLLDRIEDASWRRLIVVLALVINLGILGIFKYYNFFADNVIAFLNVIGFNAHPTSLQIVLPVGISFYTFQALSYVIDVYRKDIVATKDLVAFLAFVSFFPQLVAGPIERATNLLPQFLKPRQFDYPLAVEGCRQMLWGFFKKMIVADTCAIGANAMLGNEQASTISLWVGVACFAFQIYGDFSGYSDIAIGCSKLFGIRLMRNFSKPYFSRDIAEFWRRWHISLTTWFRDYLYIPLGGSRCGKWKKIRNTFVIFLVSGFWHGANWTFIAWGAFHAISFLPLLLRGKNRKYVTNCVAEGKLFPTFHELRSMGVTFVVAVIGWTFFRAPDISTAGSWLWKMLTFTDLRVRQCGFGLLGRVALPLAIFLAVEWFNRNRDVPMLPKGKWLRWGVYCAIISLISWFSPEPQTFIYFNF